MSSPSVIPRSVKPATPVTKAPVRPLAMIVHLLATGMAVAVLPTYAQETQTTTTEGAATLAPLTVTGERDAALTEDTGSYTTDEARTATPLGLSLRETPQSVTVVTQQRIQDQDLQTILDVVNNATGVSVNRYETSRAQFNARGFEINALMIDGIPTIWEQPWSSGEIFSSLAMYDRVEIVRGANGLMAGSGDPSASLNLARKRANSSYLRGSLEVSGGTWDTYGTLGDVSMALNEAGTVRARLVGEYNEGDSWIDLHSNQRETLYGTMDIDLSDDTTLWFGMSHQQNNSDSPMWGGLPVWNADGTRTDWSRSKTTSAEWSKWDTTYDNYFVNLDHTFANGWLANLSYSRGERIADSYLLYLYGNPDFDPTTVDMGGSVGAYHVETTQDDFSLRFSGPIQLFQREHELAFGYINSKQEFDADARAGTPGAYPIADFPGYTGNVAEPSWANRSRYGEGEVEQQAFYGVTRLNMTDELKVILGARVNYYERDSDDIYSLEPTHIDVTQEVTPYAGIIYDLTEQLSAYASYTDIFLPQSVADANGQILEPIVGESTELGLKGEFYDGRLNTSAALFQIKQDNLGVSTGVYLDPTTPALGFIYEASEGATSEGFELEVSGELAPGWNVSAGYTQFDIEDADGAAVNTLYPTKLLRTFTTYRFQGPLNKLTIGGGVNWQDSIHTYATNPAGDSEKIEQDAYALVNLMARYDITDNLSAQVNAKNVTDEKYFDIFDAYGAMTYGEPRSVTATAKYRF
ncbi:MAG: TonB-dependent siderophore receptor [Halopseudomonas sp.]|uniref:TonB-dependent siderophore receptor n=1 Tax=Halopseudomonas sp. TaxID=2901191 RepID=UPI003001CB6D